MWVLELVARMAMGIKWLFICTLPLFAVEGAHPDGTQERWMGWWVEGVAGVIHVVEIRYVSFVIILVGQYRRVCLPITWARGATVPAGTHPPGLDMVVSSVILPSSPRLKSPVCTMYLLVVEVYSGSLSRSSTMVCSLSVLLSCW